jgi:hypothetical protein
MQFATTAGVPESLNEGLPISWNLLKRVSFFLNAER